MRALRAQTILASIGAMLLFPLISAPLGAQVINEIRIDQPSTDNDEYFELFGTAGTSLNGLTYLSIGDGAGGSGTIEAVVDLTGLSIPASGYLVVAESTFALGIADFTANLNFENSDNVTHLLVSGFTGANADDLDTNDDGVLDVTPWASILDCIAILESATVPPTGTEFAYCVNSVGPDGTFVPGHVQRVPDGTGPFVIGLFDPLAGDDTPGAPNLAPLVEDCTNTIDDDADGLADCADPDCACDAACNVSPLNDDCTSATAVGEGSFAFSNTGASDDGPANCAGNLSKDVWFLFTAPCDGPTLFSTCGTASIDFNPQMAIYDGALGCPTSGTWLACDAGSCAGSGEPEILLDVVSGQTYLVQLGGFNGSCGDATLSITCPSPDCHVSPNPNYTAGYVGDIAFTGTPAASIEFSPVAFDFVSVTGVGLVTDIDVQVNTTHPFVGDLIVDIFSPANTSVRVHNGLNAGGAGNMDVRFDDESANLYDSVSMSNGSTQQPFAPLSTFDGETADGTWGITMQDEFLLSAADPARGTLDSWSVLFPSVDSIPDNNASGLDTTISFPSTNTDGINDLDVNIDIDHPATADLIVTLDSPSGTSVRLHDQSAGVNVNGRYDDSGAGFNDGFGSLVPSGPGTLSDFDNEIVTGDWTLNVADSLPGSTGTLNTWELLVCPASCTPMTSLAGSFDCLANTLTVTWTNGDSYASIDMLRDGVVIANIAGTLETFTDSAPLEGFHEYTVRGNCATGGVGQDDRFFNFAGYNGEAHIVLQLEGLVDFGDLGLVDSGAAIEAALIANGLTSVRRVSVNPEDYPCLSDAAVESIWVAAGTFPTNFLLSTVQGDLLAAASVGNIALYLESSDHWGFSHDLSTLDARDGVDDIIHNDSIFDGDDSFMGMDGLDSGNGLDLSALANVAYTQDADTTFGDETDQLLVATLDADVLSAGSIWQLDDALGTPYLTGIFSDTSAGGDLIVQSWEFGGYGGDQNALMLEYIGALGLGGLPPSGGFKRADCNADGGFNIADAISILGQLFSGAPPGPCDDACDVNDDGGINIADAISALGNLFSGAPDPATPFATCGPDPTADTLLCGSFPPCP